MLQTTLDEIGPNAKGATIPLQMVNSTTKVVRGHEHRRSGLKELLSSFLSALDPIDALTFTRSTWFGWRGGATGNAARKRKRDDDEQGSEDEDNDASAEDNDQDEQDEEDEDNDDASGGSQASRGKGKGRRGKGRGGASKPAAKRRRGK